MQKLFAIILSMVWSFSAYADPFALKLIGETIIPSNTLFDGVEVGGLSGIDLAPDGYFVAISDTRGDQHGHPRFYQLDIDYDENGIRRVEIMKQIFLHQANKSRYPAHHPNVDPESIRFSTNGNLYWASEGINDQHTALLQQPAINEMDINGQFIRTFNHPTLYNYTNSNKTGGRRNKTFESLAVDEQGSVFIASEEALKQDGKTASRTKGSIIRVTEMNPINGQPVHQYAYPLPKIPNASRFSFYQTNGLTELLAINHHRFLALERAYVAGTGNTINIVKTEILPETTDTLLIDRLTAENHRPMTHDVILTLTPKYQGIQIGNIEGISWGKTLENGHRTLLLISDNNFSTHQITQVLAFEVID